MNTNSKARYLLKKIQSTAALEAVQVEPNSNLHLSELMRGLELPPSLAAGSPAQLFSIGQAIATQAKAAVQVEPVAWQSGKWTDLITLSKADADLWEQDGDLVTPLYATPQQAAPGWQPIETAPKDGTLLVVANAEGTWLAKYQDVYQSGFKPSNPWASMLLNHAHIEHFTSWLPTHWMQIPAAPKAKS